MARLDFHSKLVEILGSENVYYDPPSTVSMKYDAIKYSRKPNSSKFASNSLYSSMNCYEVILISRKSDNPIVKWLRELPLSSHDRHYYADNLSHDVFTIYHK